MPRSEIIKEIIEEGMDWISIWPNKNPKEDMEEPDSAEKN